MSSVSTILVVYTICVTLISLIFVSLYVYERFTESPKAVDSSVQVDTILKPLELFETHIREDQNFQSVTLIVSYYNNPDELFFQVRSWGMFSPDVLKYMKFIVVDDGSQTKPLKNYIETVGQLLEGSNVDVKFVALTEDIGFNSGGAKNVGIYLADTKNVLCTDMDTLLRPDRARYVLRLKTTSSNKFKFIARKTDTGDLWPHNNCFMLQKQVLELYGMYNEDFSGHYGYEDGELWRRLQHRGVQTIGPFPWMIAFDRYTTKPVTKTRQEGISRNEQLFLERIRQNFPKPTDNFRVPHRIIHHRKPT